MYQALYRKWRPRFFSEVTGQKAVTEALLSQSRTGRLSHAYLFTGSRGTGKTTCAKILARAANCLSPQDGEPCGRCTACTGITDGSLTDVLEMDAASNRGIDNIRALRDEWAYSPVALSKRVYIIDEVHMLTNESFNALLKTLEEPPGHIMFILATTEPNKVPATISSRCQCFSFRRIPAGDITERLRLVAERENMVISGDAASLIALVADGGMRDALSILDQCASGGGEIDSGRVRAVLGMSGEEQLFELAKAVGGGDYGDCLSVFAGLYREGRDPISVLDELCGLFRDMLVCSADPGAAALSAMPREKIVRLAELYGGHERALYCAGRVQETISRLGRSLNRRVDVELCLAELCDPMVSASVSALARRVSGLEGLLAGRGPLPEIGKAVLRSPEPEKRLPEPARPVIAPEPAPKAGPEPANEAPAADGGDFGTDEDEISPPEFWDAALAELKSELPRSAYTHLAICRPVLRKNALSLVVDDIMPRSILEQHMARIESAVKSVLGREIKVSAVLEEAGPDGMSKLDELIKNADGNIKVT